MKRSGPLKRTPMKRAAMKPGPRKHSRDRAIKPDVAHHVQKRDQGCVAGLWLGAPDLCKNEAKHIVSAYDQSAWELDHVNDFDLGVSHGTADRVVVLCSWHHRGGWATSHRPLLREYLLRVETWGMTARLAGRAARKAVEGVISKVVDRP